MGALVSSIMKKDYHKPEVGYSKYIFCLLLVYLDQTSSPLHSVCESVSTHRKWCVNASQSPSQKKRCPFYPNKVSDDFHCFEYNPSSYRFTLTSVSLNDLIFSLLQFLSVSSQKTDYQSFKKRIYCETTGKFLAKYKYLFLTHVTVPTQLYYNVVLSKGER